MDRLTLALVLTVCCVFVHVRGHGRLLDPPSRSSLWRFGLSNATNYNDNQLSCGGFANQWLYHGGKCGVCGDPYQGPRENEAGGRYALGIISRRYVSGQTIDVSIEVTANHHGWFEFRICPNNDVNKKVTQSCLDQHRLSLADGSQRYNLLGQNTGVYHVDVKLPAGLTCSQCVFQWKWHTGSNYGYDGNGHSCKGCGVQEEFYGCADVAVISQSTPIVTSPQKPAVQTQTTQRTTQKPIIITQPPQTTKKPVVIQFPTNPPIIINPRPSTSTHAPAQTSGQLRCKAINLWTGIPALDNWCNDQCNTGNCPSISCLCS